MTHRARPLLALCALFAGGCYEYLPARSPAALLGQRVLISLTDSGSVALTSRIGPSVEVLEGTLLADSADAYVVGMAVTRVRGGAETDWRGERVVVAHALASVFAERRFSPARSAFAGALMSAGAVAITVALRGGGSSSGGVPTTGRPTGQ